MPGLQLQLGPVLLSDELLVDPFQCPEVQREDVTFLRCDLNGRLDTLDQLRAVSRNSPRWPCTARLQSLDAEVSKIQLIYVCLGSRNTVLIP